MEEKNTAENSEINKNLDKLTPREIVLELDKYIVGQKKAKRAVAVALRNRIRRLKISAEMREDVTPKNILMIGPTGVGKTEIARRLARLANSPFIKVEATKYTEVGYVGRDVESMIRDLMAAGVQMVKQEMQETVTTEAAKRAEDALLDLLLPGTGKKPKAEKPQPVVKPMGSFSIPNGNGGPGPSFMGTAIQIGIPVNRTQEDAIEPPEEVPSGENAQSAEKESPNKAGSETREKFRAMLRDGKLEDKTVEITVNQNPQFPAFEMMGGGMEDIESSLSGIAGFFGGNKKKKVVTVKRAREILIAEESEKLIDRDRVSDEARQRVEETGIVFIDEIDKIAVKGDRGGGPDVSREGVQRDILPIVEGATVNTKWGPVNTDHILFVAAGAFNIAKPSDLIPELQGRFPLRVELDSLGKDDFLRILTEPKNALTKQYVELLATENVEIEFTPEAVEHLAALAAEVNTRLENIGARRLHTIMEALLEELSFEAPDIAPAKVPITVEYVNEKLSSLVKDQDLGRYIL
ncbi:ATP-dependent protease ATPase subunit HslU [Leadbettera azotonutricia]|uniref:ATP-dependent protease ATPase subunit HslU n=1 Tax=Leadbettera azotonutricia (strain ATCC BAA-888 / DSM 13862 / ZAS-9) TaxID=545695 RepID=F5Y8Y8_LEAAZ|nr:ATP-dependent protease ATPase subunit HslU [Leadbettera azotonutricia]AEF83201.1 heat shock protein HslVU, ATPase subunit HslU [Leadbettera azotonutricia ZAS-9]